MIVARAVASGVVIVVFGLWTLVVKRPVVLIRTLSLTRRFVKEVGAGGMVTSFRVGI